MNKIFKVLIIILLLTSIGFSIYSELRYYSLKQDYIELKYSNTNRIDSLNREINLKTLELVNLEEGIIQLSSKIDSLENIKREIKKADYTVSESAKGSFEQLKRNLEWRN